MQWIARRYLYVDLKSLAPQDYKSKWSIMTALSKSILWRQMQAYYDQMGPELWEDDVVPLHITSNKYLARLYANLIIAQINDYLATNKTTLLPQEPFYILEIGAGHGKFSFYLLKMLTAALEAYALPSTSVCYIMTDISERNIVSWEQHPALAPYIETGMLDFAVFNAITDTCIFLQRKKIKLQKNCVSKPLFVICNYIFDTLPHDAFKITDGVLYESELIIRHPDTDNAYPAQNLHTQVSIQSPPDLHEYSYPQMEHHTPLKSISNPDTMPPNSRIADYFANASFNFKHNVINDEYYHQLPVLNKILADYKQQCSNVSFLVPIGGITCIEKLKEFTSSHLVLLIADKAVSHQDLFYEQEDPDIIVHGSASLLVNFDAIAKYVEYSAGTSLIMDNKSADFQVASFIINNKFRIPHTKFAFNSALSSFSPHDLFALCYHDDEIRTKFSSLDELLSLMQLADWDPNIFFDYYPVIFTYLEDESEGITAEQELSLLAGIDKLWNYFFKLEKNQDLPFILGMLLYNLDYPEQAITFYQQSLALFGEQIETLYNMAIAQQLAELVDDAKATANHVLQIDPEYKPAYDLLHELATV